jgi:hypothetical protein
MIPQERGLEGLSVYFIFFNYPFCLMGEISYMSFLGEGHEVLDSQELHKPIPGLLGGSFSLSLSFSFLFFCWFLTHAFIHSLIHSLARCSPLLWRFHSIHSLTHSSFLMCVLAWERKMNC